MAGDKYKPTIGIECHVQLKTKTKLFAAVSNDARGAEPNTLVSQLCFGLPGALPVLNKQVVEYAKRIAFALNTKPQKYSIFERKHYFYPDSPLGYQITQLEQPIVVGGYVEVSAQGKKRQVKLDRVQIESDAGKSTHPVGADYSLVDLNRAGTPLFEIVSEPDIYSAAEAKAYAKELYLTVRYADVSDADMYHGNMRFDVNVSISKTEELGTRTETKNLNSFKSVEKAVEYEIARQTKLLEKGQEIVQETRGWDDAKQKTFSQRNKEEAHDYRYFPEPDIPPIVLTDAEIEEAKKAMPTMQGEWRDMLFKLGIDEAAVETLLEAEVEFSDHSFLNAVKAASKNTEKAKFLANWNVNVIIPLLRDDEFKVGGVDLLSLTDNIYELVAAKKLSSTNAKLVFTDLAAKNDLPKSVEAFATKEGYIQVSDEGEVAKIVTNVLSANESAVSDVKNGETKAIGFLVGQVMKASKGKANPQLAGQLIKKQLDL